MEGEAAFGEEGRAEGEDWGAGDVGALIEQVVEDGGGGEVGAEVVAGGEVELEEGVEEEGVGGVVPGVAAGAGGEGERAETWGAARSWAVKLWRGTSGIQLPTRLGCAENWVTTAWAYW